MILVIVGPTGIGKTKLSLALAKRFSGEIINGDSMQVYRNLTIGTAKVTPDEMEGIPHHLLDIKDPDEMYTVKDFQTDCRNKIEEIKQRDHLPIVVGGTGLYLKAVFYDYEFLEEESLEDFSDCSTADLYQQLLEKDPKTEIHPNNRKRMIRALQRRNDPTRKDVLLYPDVYFIGLTAPREQIYERIDKRVLEMIDQGLIEEVQTLYDQHINGKAIMTGIGYKELYSYFDGILSLEEAITLIQKNSRHYAKRQFTWFRNQMEVEWFETDFDQFQNTVDAVASYIERKEKKNGR